MQSEKAGMDPLRICCCKDVASAAVALLRKTKFGDTVLLKASRGIGLEKVIDHLKAKEQEKGAPHE